MLVKILNLRGIFNFQVLSNYKKEVFFLKESIRRYMITEIQIQGAPKKSPSIEITLLLLISGYSKNGVFKLTSLIFAAVFVYTLSFSTWIILVNKAWRFNSASPSSASRKGVVLPRSRVFPARSNKRTLNIHNPRVGELQYLLIILSTPLPPTSTTRGSSWYEESRLRTLALWTWWSPWPHCIACNLKCDRKLATVQQRGSQGTLLDFIIWTIKTEFRSAFNGKISLLFKNQAIYCIKYYCTYIHT
jgi:hypothetical protein